MHDLEPALLRDDASLDQMIGYLDRARAAIRQPVSTAEPWHVWLQYPELVRHVDFITVHLLPYWEFQPRKDAIGYVLMRYEQLHQAYPDKKIVIGEIGWPSNGDRKKFAEPSIADEAHFLREWFNVARERKLDQELSFMARDQNVRRQGEIERPEFASADQIRDGLAAGARRHQPLERCSLDRGRLMLGPCIEPRARPFECVREQQLGIDAPVAAESRRGIGEEIAYVHFGPGGGAAAGTSTTALRGNARQ